MSIFWVRYTNLGQLDPLLNACFRTRDLPLHFLKSRPRLQSWELLFPLKWIQSSCCGDPPLLISLFLMISFWFFPKILLWKFSNLQNSWKNFPLHSYVPVTEPSTINTVWDALVSFHFCKKITTHLVFKWHRFIISWLWRSDVSCRSHWAV